MCHMQRQLLRPSFHFKCIWINMNVIDEIGPRYFEHFGWFVIQFTIAICNFNIAFAMESGFVMGYWIGWLVNSITFCNCYLHLTSNFASTDNDLAAYDSWSATHFIVSPWRSRFAGIWTIDVADHVRLLPVSRLFVWVCNGCNSWSPGLFPVRFHNDPKCKWHRMNPATG